MDSWEGEDCWGLPVPKNFEEILDGFESSTRVQVFDFGHWGIALRWSRKGHGFGEVTFGCSKDGKPFADTECMDKESLAWLIKESAEELAEALIKMDESNGTFNNNEEIRRMYEENSPGE